MKRYGLAVDIGTTTVTCGLVDLDKKSQIVFVAQANPQVDFGEDVISRIDYCIKNKTGLSQLHDAIVGYINAAIKKLAKQSFIKISDIQKVTIAGNTAMEHFFLGIYPHRLTEAPYLSNLPAGLIETTAQRVGLALDKYVRIYILPLIKSFVGSDLTAGILNTGLLDKKGANILVDIGTNGEIALITTGKLFVTSTAAGPAFEGGNTSCGMCAEKGAIEAVKIYDADRISLKVISGGRPKGICGSGFVEALSEMLKIGLIDKTGRLAKDFILFKNKDNTLSILQKDIRQIQLAKAAIMAGVLALVNKAGIDFEMIDNLYLAGNFGNYINKEAAINIGLLPHIKPAKITSVGNAAYKGAVMALCSEIELKKTIDIAKQATHLSLFGRKDFQEEFIKNISFN